MTADEFWEIVEQVHSLTPSDMQAKCVNLEAKLRAGPLHDVLNFERHFCRFVADAYTWDLWAAAFVIGDGCSDDSFMDFRSTLVSMGRRAYSNALVDPETLADTGIHPDWAHFEGYQYVARRVWAEFLGGQKEFPPDPVCSGDAWICKEVAGREFIEWELSSRLPRLAVKFNFKDADWLFLRDQRAKALEVQSAGLRLAEHLLQSGLIPSNGLIPPYKLLRTAVERDDTFGVIGTSRDFEFDEAIYWSASVHLESLAPETLALYPRLRATKLKQDLKTHAATFSEWHRLMEIGP